jgi:hypothetical protein
MVLERSCRIVIQVLRLGAQIPEHHVSLHLFPVRFHHESPSAESKFQRHDAAGVAKEDCKTIRIVLQGVGEVISRKTRAMGLKRKASECVKQSPRSGLVQPVVY